MLLLLYMGQAQAGNIREYMTWVVTRCSGSEKFHLNGLSIRSNLTRVTMHQNDNGPDSGLFNLFHMSHLVFTSIKAPSPWEANSKFPSGARNGLTRRCPLNWHGSNALRYRYADLRWRYHQKGL